MKDFNYHKTNSFEECIKRNDTVAARRLAFEDLAEILGDLHAEFAENIDTQEIYAEFESYAMQTNSVLAHAYLLSENAYVSGVLRTTIKNKCLGRQEAKIMKGYNNSVNHFSFNDLNYSPNGIIKTEDIFSHVRATTNAQIEFGKEYINRWQMYDKLFHDRVRQK